MPNRLWEVPGFGKWHKKLQLWVQRKKALQSSGKFPPVYLQKGNSPSCHLASKILGWGGEEPGRRCGYVGYHLFLFFLFIPCFITAIAALRRLTYLASYCIPIVHTLTPQITKAIQNLLFFSPSIMDRWMSLQLFPFSCSFTWKHDSLSGLFPSLLLFCLLFLALNNRVLLQNTLLIVDSRPARLVCCSLSISSLLVSKWQNLSPGRVSTTWSLLAFTPPCAPPLSFLLSEPCSFLYSLSPCSFL